MRLIDKNEVENIFAFTCYNCSCNFLIESVSDTYTIDTGYRHYEDGLYQQLQAVNCPKCGKEIRIQPHVTERLKEKWQNIK